MTSTTTPDKPSPAQALSHQKSRFTQGSVFRHVLTMTLTAAAGLSSIFVVDLLNVFYINLLDDAKLTSALGFATTLLMFQISIGIGLSIGTSIFVSRHLGADERDKAARFSASGLLVSLALGFVMIAICFPVMDSLLSFMEAEGKTLEYAHTYLVIVFPAMPFILFGMTASGILRGIGDARGAMWITLSGALVTAFLDPILILGLDMGLHGAAFVAALSRLTLFAVGYYLVFIKHKMVSLPSAKDLRHDILSVLRLSFPIILTNTATSAGVALLTRFVADYGDIANAAGTSINRLIPFVFGFLFALSGAVGPVIGQNLGARLYGRMRTAYLSGLLIGFVYASLLTLIMFIFSEDIPRLLDAENDVAELITFFLNAALWPYIFFGVLIVSNAVFNTIGQPLIATLLNWMRATIGVIPFCYYGGQIAGIKGVLVFHSLGYIPFGIAAGLIAYWRLHLITKHDEAKEIIREE